MKTFFFYLTISYRKPFVFSFSAFCAQSFTLIFSLQPNISMACAISLVKKWAWWAKLAYQVMLTIRGRLITPFILGSMSVGLNIPIRHSFVDL